jgi:hypothetical protein
MDLDFMACEREKRSFYTKPFTAIRYFARDDVTDEEIEKAKSKNEIVRMQDLYGIKKDAVLPLVREGRAKEAFVNSITNALIRSKISMEDALGGNFVYDKNCIPTTCFKMYAGDAVAVQPAASPYKGTDQIPKFSLVLGPSGSGKTMFALRGLTTILFDKDPKAYFCVHFKAGKALRQVTDRLTFPEAVAKVVQDEISSELYSVRRILLEKDEVDLFLHVVLDEAGAGSYKDFLDTADKIQSIVTAIERKINRCST